MEEEEVEVDWRRVYTAVYRRGERRLFPKIHPSVNYERRGEKGPLLACLVVAKSAFRASPLFSRFPAARAEIAIL